MHTILLIDCLCADKIDRKAQKNKEKIKKAERKVYME